MALETWKISLLLNLVTSVLLCPLVCIVFCL